MLQNSQRKITDSIFRELNFTSSRLLLHRKVQLLGFLRLLIIFKMMPITIGMQIRPDISPVFVFVAEFTDTLSLSSAGKYNHVLSAGLSPISRPSETLRSWKNDAVDCQCQKRRNQMYGRRKGLC